MPFLKSKIDLRWGITEDIRVSSYPTVTLLFETGIRRKSAEDLICDCHIKNIFLAFIIF